MNGHGMKHGWKTHPFMRPFRKENMQLETALDIRLKQRKQYLENPNYEKLSDIIKEKDTYRGKRDNYLFLSLLDDTEGNRSILIEDMEEFFLEKYRRPGINWNDIYQYYHARLESIRKGEWYSHTESDIQDVINILEKHKDKILIVYNAF